MGFPFGYCMRVALMIATVWVVWLNAHWSVALAITLLAIQSEVNAVL